jgi:hypothetical protein
MAVAGVMIKAPISLRRFPGVRRPNEVNTALNPAETENGLTDIAYVGPASVVPPAAVVPSSSKRRNPTAPRAND